MLENLVDKMQWGKIPLWRSLAYALGYSMSGTVWQQTTEEGLGSDAEVHLCNVIAHSCLGNI